MKIEIVDATAKTRQFSKDGKDYVFREQEAFLHREQDRYPTRMTISLGKDQGPYGPGFYCVSDESFYVNKYGNLDVAKEMRLLPLSDAGKVRSVA